MSEILTSFQKKLLNQIGESELSDYFVWAGGTALSYQYLQHRLSNDLDFLSKELLPSEYLLSHLKDTAKKLNIDNIEEQKKYNRHLFWLKKNKKELKIEFVFYPFPSIKKEEEVAEFKIKVDSIEDILAGKFHAVFERAEPKDIFDIYCILQKKKIEFLKPIKWVKKKFGVKIDPVLLVSKILEGVIKIKKIEPLILEKELYNPKKIKEYFDKEAREYLEKKVK